MADEALVKVNNLDPGELMFELRYRPTPMVFRVLADVIAAEAKQDGFEVVNIDMRLDVKVAAKNPGETWDG